MDTNKIRIDVLPAGCGIQVEYSHSPQWGNVVHVHATNAFGDVSPISYYKLPEDGAELELKWLNLWAIK